MRNCKIEFCRKLIWWAKAHRVVPVMIAILGCVIFASGCKSSAGHAGGAFASVVIQGNTPGQIRAVASEVFTQNGYTNVSRGPGNLVFEKRGTGMNNIAFGNWTGTPIWIRVKAAVVPESEMSYRIQCKAAYVRDRGQAAFEEEIGLKDFQAGPYQKLLDEVAARLNPKRK